MVSNINKKGSAATELVLVFPFVVLFVFSFYKLFWIATRQESKLADTQYQEWLDLRKRELAKPLLERPCEVNPKICAGRKK